MNGMLDTGFGENRPLYMAQVVGRNNRYPRNGVKNELTAIGRCQQQAAEL
jgi:hypothetical protein